MAVKKLIPATEVVEALKTVPTIDVGGEPHLDLEQVQRVVAYLGRGGDIADHLDAGNPTFGARAPGWAELRDDALRAGLFAASEPAEARLAPDTRPPGPCVGCGHAEQLHPGGVCWSTNTETSERCACDDYVDSTVRGVPVVDTSGNPYPCTCGHEQHVGQCTGWRAGHEENGQCLCMVYDPDRGPGPGDLGAIPPVLGPDPASLGPQEGRLMRNAPPRD
jgi:hypothetical protein